MKKRNRDWHDDFPIEEEVEDHAGRTRTFVITCHERPFGFTVRAEEKRRRETGYEFAVYSETTPYNALGRLRQKMYRAVATRHIAGSPGSYRMLHDKVKGRITTDGQGGVLLVVDGLPLSIDEFASVLKCHEGWDFEMTIVDSLE